MADDVKDGMASAIVGLRDDAEEIAPADAEQLSFLSDDALKLIPGDHGPRGVARPPGAQNMPIDVKFDNTKRLMIETSAGIAGRFKAALWGTML